MTIKQLSVFLENKTGRINEYYMEKENYIK